MPPVKRSEEQRYFRALKQVFNDLIQRLSFSPMTAQEIAREARRFVETDEVTGYLNRAVNRMVRSERAESARSWKEAVTKGTSSRMLYELVQKAMNGPEHGSRADCRSGWSHQDDPEQLGAMGG